MIGKGILAGCNFAGELLFRVFKKENTRVTLIHHFGANAIACAGKCKLLYSQLSRVKDVLLFLLYTF